MTAFGSTWMVLLVSLGLTFASTAEQVPVKKNLPLPGEVFTIEDRTAFLIAPEKQPEGEERPWIWYAPTLPNLPGKEEKWMFEQFLEAGIAVVGLDVGESYGNQCGTSEFSRLYDYLVIERGFSKQPGLLARSRGGLMLLNWAVENPEKVNCIGGIYPVFDLSSYPGVQRATMAYHLPYQDLQLYLSKFNPIPRAAPLAKAGVPVYCLHGDMDTLVPIEANSKALAEAYRKNGGEMTLVIQEGQGHNMWTGWFNDQGLVDFMINNLTTECQRKKISTKEH